MPYTGIGDNLKVSFFILGLIAWSAAVAYFLIRRKARREGVTVGEFIGANKAMSFASPRLPQTPAMPTMATMSARLSSVKDRMQNAVPVMATAPIAVAATAIENNVPHNLPVADDSYQIFFGSLNTPVEAPAHSDEIIATIETKARELETLVSADALETIAATAKYNKHNAVIILAHLVEIYKSDVKAGAMLVLNNEKVSAILSADMNGMIPSFTSWIVAGDETKAIAFMRMLQMQGQSVKKFIGMVAMDLESTLNSRVNNDPVVNSSVAGAVASWTDAQLAQAVATLTAAVDHNFSSTYASIKMAVLNVLAMTK